MPYSRVEGQGIFQAEVVKEGFVGDFGEESMGYEQMIAGGVVILSALPDVVFENLSCLWLDVWSILNAIK